MKTTMPGVLVRAWCKVVVVCAAYCGAMGFAGPASATLYLDQSVVIEHTAGDQTLFDINGDELQTAQTFTTRLGGTLGQIDVQIWKEVGAVGDINMSLLRLDDSGFPSENPADVLFSATIPTASIPLLGSSTVPFTSVDVSAANLAVNPGDMFAISLDRFGDFTPGVSWRRGDSTYFDGDSYARFAGDPWGDIGGFNDLGFQTWVNAGPPEPGIVNGGFETGDLTGWSAFTTPNGELSPGLPDVILNDTNGDGTSTPAARFRVGITEEAIDAGDFSHQGGGITQTFLVDAQGDYTITANISTRNFSGLSNTQPGRFELILDGNVLDTIDFAFQPFANGDTLRDALEGLAEDLTAGDHTLELRVTRAALNNRAIFQSIDDVTVSQIEMIMGDYNGSGQVEQGDLDLVLQNWGVDTDTSGIPAGWINSLPDGQVEQTELDKVLSNWGATNAPDFSGFTDQSVPEPAGLLALVLPACLRKRH